nr:(deoxy)nucleoside triphosphate pyrophosphohydrolase [uncultured Friedmanniella sp.]
MTAPRLVVGAIIVDRLDGPSQVLAARRSGPPALAGRWELPGGKVEPGESAEAALHRELVEELGVRVRLGAELVPDAGRTWPLTPGLELRAWWCELVGGIPSAGEAHDALSWRHAGNVADLPWLEPDRPLVHRIAVVLASGSPVAVDREGRLQA